MNWESVRDGFWERDDGATIHKVAPRGQTFYALRLPGSKRPEWHNTLAEAKKHAGR